MKLIAPLTDAKCRNSKPREKAYPLFDGKGLYLLISPAGTKGWRFKYRFNGKSALMSLGIYPDVSLDLARKRRDEYRALLATGGNPAENKRAVQAARAESATNSLEVIAREWLEKISSNFTEKYIDSIRRRLERHLFPWLGKKPIAGITPSDILPVLRRFEAHAVYSAHRLLINIGQIFRYAVSTGRATTDPSRDLKGALAPTKGGHRSAIIDPKRFGDLLKALDNYPGSLIVRCALKLAPLLAVRPGELRHAEWSQIDLEKAEWRFLVTKTNTPHIVPLSRQAIAVLQELQPLTGSGRFVFPNPRAPDGSRAMSDAAVLVALRTMGFGKEEMTGHGFRAAFRTIGDEVLGFRVDLIETQLAHAVKDPNGRAYNRTTFLAERREMMQRWSDYLDSLKSI